ncbi:hypothetical protein C2E20_7768 [Micractinium conductrix]|uniref:SGNH hydrolase-type esterase domain-containing protein n=1 Tax=Micractinium conductrix TaxID=554055 RepID=A0A2P6V3R8_9CHLO|nr:hypothetical protein C2E20_7768 [Micractinium conductrix]|eukprot:PSC68724.1 hypothetical protein C2E20_7768 [Micractinium conductrix]
MVAAGTLKHGLGTRYPFLLAAGGSGGVLPPLPPPVVPVDPQALLAPPWPTVLTAEEVARAEGYYGTGRRLRHLAAKLLGGRPIKAYTLGGSVTLGNGASDMRRTAYAPRFFQLLNASFPHSDHVLTNRGVGASASSLFTACLNRMVPADADLVVIEFSANEPPRAPYASDPRRSYEQLLRKVLTLGGGSTFSGGGGPAVIVLHHFSWQLSVGDGAAEGLFYASSEAELGMSASY